MDKDFLKGAGIAGALIGVSSLFSKNNVKKNPIKKKKKKKRTKSPLEKNQTKFANYLRRYVGHKVVHNTDLPNVFAVDNVLPKRPKFMFNGPEHFWQIVEDNLKAHGFSFRTVYDPDTEERLFIYEDFKVPDSNIPEDVEHMWKRANSLIRKKYKYMGGPYRAGIIHRDLDNSIFAAKVAYDYEKEEVIFFVDADKDKALVADKNFLKNKKLLRTTRDINRPAEKGVYELQRIRAHYGKPIYRNPLIEKYGFMVLIDNYTEKNNGGGGDKTAMVTFSRGGFSNKVTVKLLTDMKEFYIIGYDTELKKIVSYEVRDYFAEHQLPKGSRVRKKGKA